MTGIVIGAFVGVPASAAVIFISFAKLNDEMQKRSSTWRKYFDGFDNEDAKKPTAGTVGEWNLHQNIFSSRVPQLGKPRKAAK